MENTVKFDKDSMEGDNILHISMSGEPRAMRKKLLDIVDQFDLRYGKPVQGVNIQFGCTSHVITPKWGGHDY